MKKEYQTPKMEQISFQTETVLEQELISPSGGLETPFAPFRAIKPIR